MQLHEYELICQFHARKIQRSLNEQYFTQPALFEQFKKQFIVWQTAHTKKEANEKNLLFFTVKFKN